MYYCQWNDRVFMYRLRENHLVVIEAGSVITIVFAGVAFFVADHPAASTPAMLMAAAGLITAFSGLATAIGGQVIPVIGHWFDARREARIAEEARASLSASLKSAIDRVAVVEKMVRENEKRIVQNSELMREIVDRESDEASYDRDDSIALSVQEAIHKLEDLRMSICTKEECSARNAKVLQIISELEAIVHGNDEKVTTNTELVRQLIEKISQTN